MGESWAGWLIIIEALLAKGEGPRAEVKKEKKKKKKNRSQRFSSSAFPVVSSPRSVFLLVSQSRGRRVVLEVGRIRWRFVFVGVLARRECRGCRGCRGCRPTKAVTGCRGRARERTGDAWGIIKASQSCRDHETGTIEALGLQGRSNY